MQAGLAGAGSAQGRHREGHVGQGSSSWEGAAGPVPASNRLTRWPVWPHLHRKAALPSASLALSQPAVPASLPTPWQGAASDHLQGRRPASQLPPNPDSFSLCSPALRPCNSLPCSSPHLFMWVWGFLFFALQHLSSSACWEAQPTAQ